MQVMPTPMDLQHPYVSYWYLVYEISYNWTASFSIESSLFGRKNFGFLRYFRAKTGLQARFEPYGAF